MKGGDCGETNVGRGHVGKGMSGGDCGETNEGRELCEKG